MKHLKLVECRKLFYYRSYWIIDICKSLQSKGEQQQQKKAVKYIVNEQWTKKLGIDFCA